MDAQANLPHDLYAKQPESTQSRYDGTRHIAWAAQVLFYILKTVVESAVLWLFLKQPPAKAQTHKALLP